MGGKRKSNERGIHPFHIAVTKKHNMQLYASSALDCPRNAVQPLRCILAPKVGEVRADLDTPNRYLVNEDLSPRLEMVVVQEEAQERTVAGGEPITSPCSHRIKQNIDLR
jgi:hypothetical protein